MSEASTQARQGEVQDPAACIASIRRVLQPEGLLSISKLVGDPDAITAADLRALVESQGFVLADMPTDRAGFTAGFRRTSACCCLYPAPVHSPTRGSYTTSPIFASMTLY